MACKANDVSAKLSNSMQYFPLFSDTPKRGGNHLTGRMIKKIRSDIGELESFPERAPLYELAPDIRRLVVADDNYLVFYAVAEMVEILHVRRGECAPAINEYMK